MIHRDINCIFVHITKTAGSSISKFIGNPDSGNPHRSIFDYEKVIGKENKENYFKFTVVRNPWERMVSEYHYQTQRTDGKAKKINFENYLRKGNMSQTGNQLDWIASPKWIWDKDIGDWSFKSDETILLVDKVIRYENLKEDFDQVRKSLGLKGDLPMLNTSKHGTDYRKYYNDISHSIVLKKHERDINYFKYKF